MNLSELTLIAYYCADNFGNRVVSNEGMRDFLGVVTGQEVTLEEFRDIQRHLRLGSEDDPRRMITSTGEPTGPDRPGRWYINDEGRRCARALLTTLLGGGNP